VVIDSITFHKSGDAGCLASGEATLFQEIAGQLTCNDVIKRLREIAAEKTTV
jgi:hypothetical protein